MNGDDDEETDPPEDVQEEPDECPHDPECEAGKGRLHVNWRRLVGMREHLDGPWVWRSIPVVGEECACLHLDDCALAADERASWWSRTFGGVR